MTEPPRKVFSSPDAKRRAVLASFGLLLLLQAFFSFQGLAEAWTRGHNGWGGAAYHNSARNTLRWGILFPVEYDTGADRPGVRDMYTHHPLALHLHTTFSVWLFGDHEWAVRLVPAVHGVLACAMLFLLARRFFGDAHALLATTVYVAFPINAIYANMAMHSLGFFVWSLLMFYCFLRWQEERGPPGEESEAGWRFLLGVFGAFVMAAFWDWPAYYLAFVLALFWFIQGLRRQRAAGGSPVRFGLENRALVLFCVVVIAMFVGHFGIVVHEVGSLDELRATFAQRQGVPWERFAKHLEVVPALMYTWSVLVMGAAWLVAWVVRGFRRRGRLRDVVLVAFAVAGVVHFFLFKESAIQHSYWGWTANPFLALAVASVVLSVGRGAVRFTRRALGTARAAWVRRLVPPLAGAAAGLLLLVPLAIRAVEIVPPARAVGGSMWFVVPGVRGSGSDRYDSGRPELLFAEHVRRWTTRATGVMIHNSFRALRPEPRFTTVLDREVMWTPRIDGRGPPRPGVTDGWVAIGLVGRFAPARLAKWAAEHPFRQLGRYFMVDFRTEGSDVAIWDLAPGPVTPMFWFFHSASEPPLVEVRNRDAERRMRDQLALRDR